jgi:hypothetical protein
MDVLDGLFDQVSEAIGAPVSLNWLLPSLPVPALTRSLHPNKQSDHIRLIALLLSVPDLFFFFTMVVP